MEFPTSNLWNYSTQIWTLPGVESTCLDLQYKYGFNANLLLYCCWIGDQRLLLKPDQVRVLINTSDSWETVIRPLRESRNMMKQSLIAMPPELIDQTLKNISEMELNAERMEQMALEKALPLSSIASGEEESEIDFSLSNLKNYIESTDSSASTEELMQHVGKLLSSIYQDEESVQMALMSNLASN